MVLSELSLVNFKNYREEKFRFGNDVITITGDNGMGKTNLLDAVYYLAMGKSYLVASDKNLIFTDMDFFRLDARFADKDENYHLVIKYRLGHGKEMELNGKKLTRISDHVGMVPVVFISPDDVHNLLSGNEERRVFINNTLVQTTPEYLEALVAYNRGLKQRNALLKDFADRNYWDADLLDVITLNMAPHAALIFQTRSALAAKLNPYLQQYYNDISNGKETVALHYNSQLDTGDFVDLSSRSIAKDRILQRSFIGIHRDEIGFFMNGRPIKDFASQGQLKSYIFGLKLAQYSYLKETTHKEPILLLDDVFDKLDQGRVQRLLSLIRDRHFGQIFISDTHHGRAADLLRDADCTSFIIENGAIAQQGSDG